MSIANLLFTVIKLKISLGLKNFTYLYFTQSRLFMQHFIFLQSESILTFYVYTSDSHKGRYKKLQLHTNYFIQVSRWLWAMWMRMCSCLSADFSAHFHYNPFWFVRSSVWCIYGQQVSVFTALGFSACSIHFTTEWLLTHSSLLHNIKVVIKVSANFRIVMETKLNFVSNLCVCVCAFSFRLNVKKYHIQKKVILCSLSWPNYWAALAIFVTSAETKFWLLKSIYHH